MSKAALVNVSAGSAACPVSRPSDAMYDEANALIAYASSLADTLGKKLDLVLLPERLEEGKEASFGREDVPPMFQAMRNRHSELRGQLDRIDGILARISV